MFWLCEISAQNYILASDRLGLNKLYYFNDKKKIIISDNLRNFKKYKISKNNINTFLLSGYCIDDSTIYENIYSVIPGGYVELDLKLNTLKRKKYIKFNRSVKKKKINFLKYYKKFDELLNYEFKKIINKNLDKTIYVPLSGGLDSRLILCKLIENKCKNLVAFSYGSIGNFETIKSKKISKKFGVKWLFLNSKNIKNDFFSKSRKQYSKVGFGKFLPPMREYFAINELYKKKFNKKILIINGQTGDYISGGQIPKYLIDTKKINLNKFINEILNKNISYWKGNKDTKLKIFKKLKTKYKFLKNKSNEIKLSELEKWNFYNRQSNIVITDVLLYEFFNFDWEMPFWSKKIVSFFNHLPINERYNKKFYIKYLQKYNYNNSFENIRKGSSWTIYTSWTKYLANFLGLFDLRLKDLTYSFMRYFGHYKYLYSWVKFKFYLKNFNKIKNQEAFFTYQILKEYNLLKNYE